MMTAALLVSSAPAVVSFADNDPKPTNIKASVEKKTVTKGKKFELRAITTPLDADDDSLIWRIESGKKVIRFDDDDR